MTDKSYNNWSSMTDKSLIEVIGKFVQHHRLKQNRSQTNVANAAGISRSTLSLLERGEKINLSSLLQVLRVLDLLYVLDAFKVTQEISPVQYAKIQKKQRQRARNSSIDMVNEDPIEW
ncbi:XRE family transcriptional regulator [Prolixibacteraceae bacterium JC049]|nr:XRE family transcriptional regulator [Prolixibacteraceae bacterium JC049]